MKDKKDAVLIARVPKDLKVKLETKAKHMGEKVSEVIRLACEKFLK
jgi:antitoxin component of RelBE/YafQ-DinJ toxin-antitoxin module